MKQINIITSDEYYNLNNKYSHLIEVNLPSNQMIENEQDWIIRESFLPFGTLLVGDLRVIKQETAVFEIHPFPEWVVQIYLPKKKVGTVYALVPKWSVDYILELGEIVWADRLLEIQNKLNKITMDQ